MPKRVFGAVVVMRDRKSGFRLAYFTSSVLVGGCLSGQPNNPPEAAPLNERCFVQRALDRPPATDRSAMCQALEDNLNDFCAGPSPMCGLRFSPNHEEFRLPAWMSLDVSENLALLENMVRGRAYAAEIRNRGVTGYEWSLVEERLRDPTGGPARLAAAQVDIMNRGLLEPIYEFWPNTCDASIGPAANARILVERYAQIMTNPEWRAAADRAEMSFPGQAAFGGGLGNVFLYEGTAFLFLWGGLDPYVAEISSDRFGNVGASVVCSFDYQPNNQR